jgi:hypothetical protein
MILLGPMDDSMPAEIKDFIKWKSATDSVMAAIYGIDTNEAGLDDERLRSHWIANETPDAFVEWFARKYDLISKRDMGIEGW